MVFSYQIDIANRTYKNNTPNLIDSKYGIIDIYGG